VSRRSEKLSEEIKREMSQIVRSELKDPRISAMVSVTRVEVSRDLSYAKIFISLLGDKEESEKTLEGLMRAKGFIKRELSKKIRTRFMPEISFFVDHSIEYGAYINQLIEKVRQNEGNDHSDDNI